jgi:branched-chain amino acid transport system permease protein
MLTLFLFFRFTKTGLAMRATASNRVAAGLMGINVGSVSMISWGLGSFLAAVGGILTAPVQLLDPYFMTLIGIKAFAAAVLGGLTSLPGAIAGGLLLGIAENLVGGYLANELKVVFPFVLIVATLTLRPDGLFGAIHRWKLQQ